jgi:hypothetical protein
MQLTQQSEKTFRSFNKVVHSRNAPCAWLPPRKSQKGHCLRMALKYIIRPGSLLKWKQKHDFRRTVVSNRATAAIG